MRQRKVCVCANKETLFDRREAKASAQSRGRILFKHLITSTIDVLIKSREAWSVLHESINFNNQSTSMALDDEKREPLDLRLKVG